MNEEIVNPKDSPIKLKLDDFDFDSFDVKPLNKGLGFHKSTQQVRPVTKTYVRPQVQVVREEKAPIYHSQNQNVTIDAKVLGNLFGDQKKKEEPIVNIEVDKAFAKLEQAPSSLRACAWAIDLLLIATVNLALFSSFLLLAGHEVSLGSWFNLFSLNETIVFAGLFFSFIYISYFTILDMNSTLGKSLMGLRVKHLREANLSVMNTLVRTTISLLSFIALGLPLILDFHSRLSDTIVIRK